MVNHIAISIDTDQHFRPILVRGRSLAFTDASHIRFMKTICLVRNTDAPQPPVGLVNNPLDHLALRLKLVLQSLHRTSSFGRSLGVKISNFLLSLVNLFRDSLHALLSISAEQDWPMILRRAKNLLFIFLSVHFLIVFGTANSILCMGSSELRTDVHGVTYLRGIGFWPTNYSSSYLEACFSLLKQGSDLVFIQRPLFETSENQAQLRVFEDWLNRGAKAGLKKYIAIEPFSEDRKTIRPPSNWRGPPPRLSDKRFQELYLDKVGWIARQYTPEYMNVAVEANMYYHYNPEDYEHFPALFNSLRDKILSISPKSSVFASYQYEVLQGKAAFVKGPPQIPLLKRLALKQDLIGISSYPLFLNPPYEPQRIPNDYFHAVKTMSDLPVFISEIGWYSSESDKPRSSRQSQADFIEKLPQLLKDINVQAICWITISDLKEIPELKSLKKANPQFFSLGLTDHNLNPKPSWKAWLLLGRKTPEISNTTDPEMTTGQPLSPDAFVAIGATISIADKGTVGKSLTTNELQWHYRRSTNPIAAILNQGVRLSESARGLVLELSSHEQTTIAVVLVEKGGAQYEKRLQLPAGRRERFELAWGHFTLQEDSRDEDNRLRPGDIVKLLFIDISAFLGQEGSNSIAIRNLASF